MTPVVGEPPVAGQCHSLLLLPPFADENYLRCRRMAGHNHPANGQPLHVADDPSGTRRRWPESMAAKLARITPLDQPKGTP